MTSSSIFYWVVDQLAEQVSEQGLADRLREVSAENLGWLALEDFAPAQQQELRQLLARLPSLARSRLPEGEGKDRVLEQLEQLAADVSS